MPTFPLYAEQWERIAVLPMVNASGNSDCIESAAKVGVRRLRWLVRLAPL